MAEMSGTNSSTDVRDRLWQRRREVVWGVRSVLNACGVYVVTFVDKDRDAVSLSTGLRSVEVAGQYVLVTDVGHLAVVVVQGLKVRGHLQHVASS